MKFFSKIAEPILGAIAGSTVWHFIGEAAFTLLIAFLSAIVAYWGKRLCLKYFESNKTPKNEQSKQY